MASLEGDLDSIVKRDDRLKKLVEDLPKLNYGKDYSKVEHAGRKGFISLHDIYPMAEQNFPLCMQEVFHFKVDAPRVNEKASFEALC